MSSPAVVVNSTLTLPEARALLRTHRVRRMPVVNEHQKLIGIVTEGDINRISDSHVTDVREYNLYYRISELPIKEMMTTPVITATPDMRLREVAELMLNHKIGGLPVVEDDHVVGMITESDLFREMIALLTEIEDREQADISAKTPH
jgi:CBS domain-containing protein